MLDKPFFLMEIRIEFPIPATPRHVRASLHACQVFLTPLWGIHLLTDFLSVADILVALKALAVVCFADFVVYEA